MGVGLAEVLGEEGGSKLPWLRHLSVRNCGLTQDGGDWLLGVIEGGACPRLSQIAIDDSLVSRWAWKVRLRRRGVAVTRYS